ncbi:PREDICTED: DNA-dependent metalloprotease WSS1 [Nicotiana attenuata]|uniref:Uncharacterized protein n=1 Tax=Nicotiana attenuata TaxID=49451 RepID=A0A1J6JSH2_NICAT|nr:PREDICTED: DNA-dependent metalloprotease WSS1 [Nicotiana attenuata]OIT20690.1 hypothetical protein A4A49_37024 [Nicotiana attenuata]
MNLGDLNKVWEIKALKRKPKHEEATKILERIAKQVQPIMRKHNWRVKLLSEFCPKRPALLGLNVGAGIHVKLRLRRPNNDEQFYPYNEVLDTMLHELCHNTHGPHNASFYRLWDEIRKECEDLMTKGISGTGEGFDLPGIRLGGLFPQPSISSLRQTAAAAAENRARLKSLLPSGPRRLGGDRSIKSALTPIQAAAMAAERRLQDNIWCGSESCDLSDIDENSDSLPEPLPPQHTSDRPETPNGFDALPSKVTSRKRSRESNSISSSRSLQGTKPLPNHDKEIARKVGRAEGTSHTVPSRGYPESFVDLSGNASSSTSMHGHDDLHGPEEPMMWECLMCTFLNPPLAPVCKLCQNQKPKDVDDRNSMWSCKLCTLDNSLKSDHCTACGEWRYSHGPPIATPAPNLGT